MKSSQDTVTTTHYGSLINADGDVTIIARGKEQGEGLPNLEGDINVRASEMMLISLPGKMKCTPKGRIAAVVGVWEQTLI